MSVCHAVSLSSISWVCVLPCWLLRVLLCGESACCGEDVRAMKTRWRVHLLIKCSLVCTCTVKTTWRVHLLWRRDGEPASWNVDEERSHSAQSVLYGRLCCPPWWWCEKLRMARIAHSYYKNPVFHYLSNQPFLFLHIQELLSGDSDMAGCEWGSTMRLRSDHHHCLYASYEMLVPWDMQLLYCWFEQSRRWSGSIWLLNTAYCDSLKYLLWWQEQYKRVLACGFTIGLPDAVFLLRDLY